MTVQGRRRSLLLLHSSLGGGLPLSLLQSPDQTEPPAERELAAVSVVAPSPLPPRLVYPLRFFLLSSQSPCWQGASPEGALPQRKIGRERERERGGRERERSTTKKERGEPPKLSVHHERKSGGAGACGRASESARKVRASDSEAEGTSGRSRRTAVRRPLAPSLASTVHVGG